VTADSKHIERTESGVIISKLSSTFLLVFNVPIFLYLSLGIFLIRSMAGTLFAHRLKLFPLKKGCFLNTFMLLDDPGSPAPSLSFGLDFNSCVTRSLAFLLKPSGNLNSQLLILSSTSNLFFPVKGTVPQIHSYIMQPSAQRSDPKHAIWYLSISGDT